MRHTSLRCFSSQPTPGESVFPMILKIDKVSRQDATVFVLSGRITEDYLPELQLLLDAEPEKKKVTLDLKEIRLVEREAMKFLAACQARGVELLNCPGYVREWIVKENHGFWGGQETK
jgi:hypothetical protein